MGPGSLKIKIPVHFHLADALGDVDTGLRLVTEASEGGHHRSVGGSVQVRGGLSDFQFLLGPADLRVLV